MYCQQMSKTLQDYVNHSDSEKGIGCYNALLVLLQLAYCIQFYSQYEIVHNDIKLDNIMLDHTDNLANIRWIDFGESFVGFDQLSNADVLKKGNLHYK